MYQDIKILKKLRNECAHSIENISLNADKVRKAVEGLKVPKRKCHDWGKLRVFGTDDGAIVFSEEKPENAIEEVKFPGVFSLLMAIPLILFVLVSNLELPIAMENEQGNHTFIIKLPDYMKES